MQPDELAKVFREKLRARRLEVGMTQAQLAEAVGMHQPHIADLERGVASPTLATIAKIAAALRMHPDELLKPLVLEPV